MKYTILIDQRAVAERFPELDLKDAALLAFMADAFNSPNLKKRWPEYGVPFTWLKHSTIREQMPLLKLTTDDAVSRRLRRLRENGLIETHLFDGAENCHRPGKRWDELTGIRGTPPDEKEGAPGSNRDTPPDEKEGAVYKGSDYKDQTIKEPPTPQGGKPQAASGGKRFLAPDACAVVLANLPPEHVTNGRLTLRLGEFYAHRFKHGKKPTEEAARRLGLKLAKFDPETCATALENSCDAGWAGVFPESVKTESTTEAMTQPNLAKDWGFGDD